MPASTGSIRLTYQLQTSFWEVVAKRDRRKGMAYGMVGETLYEVSRNGSLPGSWHRVLVRRLKFRGVGLGVVTGSLLGGILIGNFFHVPVSGPSQIARVPPIPFRNRLLGGA